MKLKVDDANTLSVVFDGDDLCGHCKNAHKCPLIFAMIEELVVLKQGDFHVAKCGHFKRFTASQILRMTFWILFFITVLGLEIFTVIYWFGHR